MSSEEYKLYCYCVEFHSELRRKFSMKETSIQISRMLSQKLNCNQIQQVIQDIELIKRRGGSILNYFIVLIYPILNTDHSNPQNI
jgi:hypothetical protein